MDDFDPKKPDSVDRILTAINWTIVAYVVSMFALLSLMSWFLNGWPDGGQL